MYHKMIGGAKMFIYSVRASTIKFFTVMLVGIVALVALIVFIPTVEEVPGTSVSAAESVTYDNVKTNEDRISFLSQFGWTVEAEPCEEQKVTIPSEFDSVFTGYNDIQKAQGLDLSAYSKREMNRYTYVVTNYEGYEGLVYANLLVYKDRVVAGDICSADVNGFVHGFEKSGS